MVRGLLVPIIDKIRSVRHLEFKCLYYREPDDPPRQTLTSIKESLDIPRSLPDLQSLLLPEVWSRPEIFAHLSTFSNLLQLSFTHIIGNCSFSDSPMRNIPKISTGPFEFLEELSFPEMSAVELSNCLVSFPANHSLKSLNIECYIPPELSQKLIHHFPELRYLHSSALSWTEDPNPNAPLTLQTGFTPLKSLNLVELSLIGALIPSQTLIGALDSWPNLEVLNLTGPGIPVLSENREFNPNYVEYEPVDEYDMQEFDPGNQEVFASTEPVGLGIEVLGMIARCQRKIKSVVVSVACYDTSQLTKPSPSPNPNPIPRFSPTLNSLTLRNSFYNCHYTPFHICDAVTYLASLAPLKPNSNFDFSVTSDVDGMDDDDLPTRIVEEFGEYVGWYKVLCERIQGRVMKAWVREMARESVLVV